MQAVAEVKNISKQFGGLTAVDDLSFSVNKGDVYGFLGQNGAGKSTTIRMLLSLIKPTGGNIEIFGLKLHNHRREILSSIGAMIEKPDVYKYLSAYNNLKLFARMSGIHPTEKLLLQQLETVGLKERAHSRVQEFSQGMKQRLGIAIALVHNPQLIILDEPTNGLDPQGIADVRNLILHLSQQENKTLIVSSHLLNEMEQVATRLLIIEKGKKVVEGDIKTLFDPAETLLELDTLNNEAAFALIQNSRWQHALLQQRSRTIILKMHRSEIPAFNNWLVAQNVQVVSLQSRHSLEDYFLQVTGAAHHVAAFSN